MRVLVTAGPTRQYIDAVRFITNSSSGRMGYQVAAAAVAAGHEVTLLTGPVGLTPPEGCRAVHFTTYEELKFAVAERFAACDALVMAAAVGDFRVANPARGKLRRSAGPVDVRLVPTESILAGLAPLKKPGQTVIAFAMEEGTREQMEAKARQELAVHKADFVVVNTTATMAAEDSEGCIITAVGVVLPWDIRPKDRMAGEIVKLLAR